MLDRIPRWMIVKNHQSGQTARKEKSVISRSDRYAPIRSNKSEISQYGEGVRQIAQNLSQNISQIPSIHNGITKSAFNYPGSDEGILGQSQGNFKGTFGSQSIQGSKSKSKSIQKSSIQKSNIRPLQKELAKFEPVSLQKANQRDLIQNQFKHYLKFIEDMERDFFNRKTSIQNVLESRQDQIKRVKDKIIDYFTMRGQEIKDRQLRRVIESRFSDREKPQKKSIFQLNLDKKLNEIQKSMFELALEMKGPESIRSTGQWAKKKFGHVFEVLDQLKENLNDCQHIRGSKIPEKRNFLETRGNIVNINVLRVKSKKTHE